MLKLSYGSQQRRNAIQFKVCCNTFSFDRFLSDVACRANDRSSSHCIAMEEAGTRVLATTNASCGRELRTTVQLCVYISYNFFSFSLEAKSSSFRCFHFSLLKLTMTLWIFKGTFKVLQHYFGTHVSFLTTIEFCESSTFGEFPHRLHLLKAFSNQFQKEWDSTYLT